MEAALRHFISEPSMLPKAVILGDMLELGSYSAQEHRKIVELLQEARIEEVFLVGRHFTEAGADCYPTFPRHRRSSNLSDRAPNRQSTDPHQGFPRHPFGTFDGATVRQKQTLTSALSATIRPPLGSTQGPTAFYLRFCSRRHAAVGIAFPHERSGQIIGSTTRPDSTSPSHCRSTTIFPSGWGTTPLIRFKCPGCGAIRTCCKSRRRGLNARKP